MLSKADEYRDAGDLRFAAQLLQQAVYTEPDHAAVKERLAAVYERLGHGSENATWRNFYLTGAYELRNGVIPQPLDTSGGMAMALSIDQLFDTLAIRVDAARCWNETIAIDWHFTDTDQRLRTTLRNGVLVQEPDPKPGDVDLTMTLTKPQLLGLLASKAGEGIKAEGDADAFNAFSGTSTNPTPASPSSRLDQRASRGRRGSVAAASLCSGPRPPWRSSSRMTAMSVNVHLYLEVDGLESPAEADRIGTAVNLDLKDHGIESWMVVRILPEPPSVTARSEPYAIIVRGFGEWSKRFEHDVKTSIHAIAPQARINLDWGFPDEE